MMDEVLLHVEENPVDRQNEGGTKNELLMSEEQHSGSSYYDGQAEGQRLSCGSHDYDDDDSNGQNCCTGPYLASENAHLSIGSIECELPSNSREGESPLSELKWLERDESVALWVKWRGKWHAGIRCTRADWPLSTLKAKPTHDRKQYFVVFFPHTRNYSWVDMLLVRPIDEYPHPIAYRSHKVGLKMVRDLTVPRRYIMQKLAVGMLNIIDQFHFEALIDTARNVVVWKEFAMEASRCSGYSDLGMILLKLQRMILPHYLNSDWLQESFHSWVEQCQNANSAETIELLKEELFDSILWNEVRSLGDAPVQPALGSEWKTWKHEVMKWFSTSHPVSTVGDVEHQNNDSPSNTNLQVSRKRPKLEVRRAETHASLVQINGSDQTITVEIDSDFFNSRDSIDVNMRTPELCKKEDEREETKLIDTSNNLPDRWENIVVEAGHSELIHSKDVEITPAIEEVTSTSMLHVQPKEVELMAVTEAVSKKSIDSGSKNRQCIAFIESKGRQCVRWANDGDVYCCVHLASRFIGSSGKTEATPPVDSPLCEGTTVLGTRCKHRSLYGSSYCKKHRPKNDANISAHSPDHVHKRKLVDIIPNSENTYCRDIVLVGDSGSPLQVESVSVIEGNSSCGINILIEKPDHSSKDLESTELLHCIGIYTHNGFDPCHESPKRHSLYCDKHLPSWLKRARNGKSRIVSKEVFLDLLKDCYSLEQKLHLHQACELFYKLFKSILSLRNPVPMEVQLQWALSEASKDFRVGEILMKLVYSEKERLQSLWGFAGNECVPLSFVEEPVAMSPAINDSFDDDKTIKCKVCSVEFSDEQQLSTHWMENHKKEAQWLFRGYACAICLDSFTNKKVLESHVQERHHVQFVEQCMLHRCIPCGGHFGNTEELWLHVQSAHTVDFRQSKIAQQHNQSVGEKSPPKLEFASSASLENNAENVDSSRKLNCRFCGLKFDLLPDLGRHHQAAHMGPSLANSRPPKRGVRYYAYKLKSGRLSRPRFKKGLGAVSYRIRNRAAATMKKLLQASKSIETDINSEEPRVIEPETENLGRLADFHCSAVAKILFSKIHKRKPRPNNLDILSTARTSCCKVSLKASLEEKYGALPERMYLKAAKLCSEHNIQIEWHQEEFVCVNRCNPVKDSDFLSGLIPLPYAFGGQQLADPLDHGNEEWELDECHCIIDSKHFKQWPMKRVTLLCSDISFGKESVQVACVVDEDLADSICISVDMSSDQKGRSSMPWENFTYVTKSSLDQSFDLDAQSLQLGCTCSDSACCPEKCDHVYLFDNDYEDARDIYGKPMRGRFPYDDKGRIILEEGYLVYECNQLCSCNRSCPNRVLQNGVRVKLEVFKTENKGWGVRAGEPILNGTFVCEYIGEIIDELEANNRLNRYGQDSCNYMYNIDSHINDMSRLIEGQANYIIDATKYGNVSRFINHSCSPNLVNHQVLVDSMDCQYAHIGLYASKDIAMGEELTYDYQYQLLPGLGYPCQCGTSACRGRLPSLNTL